MDLEDTQEIEGVHMPGIDKRIESAISVYVRALDDMRGKLRKAERDFYLACVFAGLCLAAAIIARVEYTRPVPCAVPAAPVMQLDPTEIRGAYPQAEWI